MCTTSAWQKDGGKAAERYFNGTFPPGANGSQPRGVDMGLADTLWCIREDDSLCCRTRGQHALSSIIIVMVSYIDKPHVTPGWHGQDYSCSADGVGSGHALPTPSTSPEMGCDRCGSVPAGRGTYLSNQDVAEYRANAWSTVGIGSVPLFVRGW